MISTTPGYKAVDDNALAADAPVDAFAEVILRRSEYWLWDNDAPHLSLPYYFEGSPSELIGQKLACLTWARLVCLPVRLQAGMVRFEVDLTCYVSSQENVGEAGIDVWLELVGFGSSYATIGAHLTAGFRNHNITLELDAPLDVDLTTSLCVWFKSQIEDTITDTFNVLGTDIYRGYHDYGLSFPSGELAGLYTVQAINSAGDILYNFDLYDADVDLFYASSMVAFEGAARLIALGWVILASAELRIFCDGDGL